jgi:hypothetical protein
VQSEKSGITITTHSNELFSIDGNQLNESWSESIFKRKKEIKVIKVHFT